MPNNNVPAPSAGLGSNSNYIIYDSCNNLTGLVVTIKVTADIICTADSAASSGTQESGFGFQLNAYSPKNNKSAWQQYVISLFGTQLNAVVNNWPVSGPYLLNNYADLSKVPNLKVPAGYSFVISLQNDTSGNITGASFVVRAEGVAPAPGSALTGYWGSDSSQHVNFVGTDGHVRELYIHPGANWVNNDLTAFSGGGVLPKAGTALTGYWGSDNSQHVNFIGSDGHVHELYIHPGANWVNNDLTALAGGGVLPLEATTLTGYWGSDNSQHVNFVGTDGHVHELYIHPGANWVNNDLTALSGGGVLPLAGTALTGYWGSDSSQHVNFVGTDRHVHELYIHPGANWVNNDLTALSGGGVLPLAGTALTGYWGSDSSQHVNFIGTDRHVHELYIHPGSSWVNNDLTAFSGNGVAPTGGSVLHAYWGSDSSQHVNFVGTDGHVHELYIHPGASWSNNDLTDVLQAQVTQTLLDISGVDKTDIAPITAFEMNLVGPANSETATFSSCEGTFAYTASAALTALSSEPACTESGYVTAEKANTIYGELPSGPQNSFTQSFSFGAASKMIGKTGKFTRALPGRTGTKLLPS
jgi:hypothetical protein